VRIGPISRPACAFKRQILQKPFCAVAAFEIRAGFPFEATLFGAISCRLINSSAHTGFPGVSRPNALSKTWLVSPGRGQGVLNHSSARRELV
jgi:hypothetical protein